MKIRSVRIHNFRSISDATIHFGPYSLLVGPNNCGKSNIIDALRTFYEKRDFEPERDTPKHKGATAGESWVEVEFALSSDEWSGLKEEYKIDDHILRLRKWFVGGPSEKKGVFAYEKNDEGKAVPSEHQFYGWNDVNKLGTVIYIPALSKLDEHTKLSGPSALRDIIGPIIAQVMSDSGAQDGLKEAVAKFGVRLRGWTSPDGKPVIQHLEKEITNEITKWGLSFEFAVNDPDPSTLVKSLVSHKIKDSSLNGAQDSESLGQGFQRHLIFTLLKLKAKYGSESKAEKRSAKGKKQPKDTPVSTEVRKEFAPSLLLLLFEEPEAFLHPEQIDALHAALEEWSQGASGQVVVTTHNPQFASNNIEDLTAFARLTRVDGETVVRQVTKKRLDEILAANCTETRKWMESGLNKFRGIGKDDLEAEMESIKYALWLNPVRCKALFANRVLLVEGPTETALLGYMAATGKLAAPANTAFLMDAMGKFNIHRFMKLLGELGIEHAVLYDGDDGKYETTVDASIQACRNASTIAIDSFPGNIEAELGVPHASEPHRKPQHVMYHLVRGKVTEMKLGALAAKVNALFAPQSASRA